jgi:TonB family protein
VRVTLTLVALAAGVLAGAASASPAQERAKTMPVLVREVKPDYTKPAMDRKIQGTVLLEIVVKADGTVADNVRITRSLDPDLDQQAIKAAKQWTFKPGTLDGKPVPVTVSLELTFTLRPGTKAAAPAQSPHKPGEEGVVAPVLVHDVKPHYPQDAMDRKVQGRVALKMIVKADGTVGNVEVTAGLDPELDQEAIKAAKQWGFRAGTKNGKAVDVEVQAEMTFTLR